MHLSAPHQQGHCGFEQLGELLVEGGFVDDYAALFAAQVAGAAGQGGNAPAGSEADNKGQYGFFVVALDKHFFGFFDFTGGQVVKLRPVGAVADKFERHVFVVADIPGIHAFFGRGQ